MRGYVSAYDAETGKHAVALLHRARRSVAAVRSSRSSRKAAKTWNGEWWKLGGGGTVWDSMAYDPELDLLYIGTGNGSPWNQQIRSPGGGDNLFLASIVALKPDTGEYVWHYQTTPGETWDYTATQHIVLADLTIDGQPRKVLMQAPKNGFFYVLDRTNGELISAKPFAPVNWATAIDLEDGPAGRESGGALHESEAAVRSSCPGRSARTTGIRCRSARRPAWCTCPRNELACSPTCTIRNSRRDRSASTSASMRRR